jgi:hypothetical protein
LRLDCSRPRQNVGPAAEHLGERRPSVCRSLAPRLATSGLDQIDASAQTAIYNGGSPWAQYWTRTVSELRESLTASGHLEDGLIELFLSHCADPSWWTQTIAFTAVSARKPAG